MNQLLRVSCVGVFAAFVAFSSVAGLPAGVVTPAVLLLLGDSVNEDEHEHLVGAIEIAGSRYTAE